MYFKINLNRFGELKLKMAQEKRTFINSVISFVVISLIMYGFVFYVQTKMEDKIKARQDFLNEIKDRIKATQSSGDYLSSDDLTTIADVSKNRIFWAKKLVALAEKTSDKIAITHFQFKRGVLTLYGITQVDKDVKEYSLIDEFIEELKQNEQISADFPEIFYEQYRRDKEKDTDIIRFQVDCYSRESGKKSLKRSRQ
jgi:hypothetical protein